MLCKIADLLTEIPDAGGFASRCRDYLWHGESTADIHLSAENSRLAYWSNLTEEDQIYMDTGFQFYSKLLYYDGMMLHASAVEYKNQVYLFSGPCGVGKSTHARLWQQVFGPAATVINDDKPALRRLDCTWYAYGTPWCGKDGINQNIKAPLAGLCFLKQGDKNIIRTLSPQEAIIKVIHQTQHRYKFAGKLDLMLSLADKLVREIPVFELENRPEPEAALLSYETMHRAAQEAGL